MESGGICSRLGGNDRNGRSAKGGLSCFRGNDSNRVPLLFLLFMVLLGCQVRREGAGVTVEGLNVSDTTAMSVKYAKGFRVEHTAGQTILILSDPQSNGKEIARYRLLEAESVSETPVGYTDIQIPVAGLAASSTTHAGFLSALGAGNQLMGCNNPERLYDTVLFNRYQRGQLMRMGRDLEYNLEYLIASKPGLVLQTGIDGQFVPDARLAGMGIPVMFVLEWMESTPLARAEWIRVFGLITGKLHQADSLFNEIEANYMACAALGRNAPEKVKVLTGNVFKGTWYMPGGKNYMTRFFEDAGMEYLYKDTDQSASLALSFESVVYRHSDAPVWISVNVDSLSQLIAAEERYAVFKAVKDHRVYSVFNRINDHGGNDFWESAVVRPDWVLADLLAIAHPELKPDHNWNYYKPLVFNR